MCNEHVSPRLIFCIANGSVKPSMILRMRMLKASVHPMGRALTPRKDGGLDSKTVSFRGGREIGCYAP
jgi:hypothetical protein